MWCPRWQKIGVKSLGLFVFDFGTQEAHGHLASFSVKDREDFMAMNRTTNHSTWVWIPLDYHLVVLGHLGPSWGQLGKMRQGFSPPNS